MPTPNGLLRGPKFSDAHSTIIEVAVPTITIAKAMDEVTKIVLGRITVVRGMPRIKFSPIRAGLKLMVRGGNAQQDFYLYTRTPREVEERLLAAHGGR